MLRISKTLKFPLDFVTQACAIVARRGAGKTYTGMVAAEELLRNKLPVCVIDPIGVWYGLRTSADGKGDGLPIVIFGGDHGDLPLEPHCGGLVADVVVEKALSVVLDLSLMRKGEQDRFVADFCERLFHKNRKPLHLMVDEADSFAPQRPMPGQQRMLGAMEDVVRKGRARGLGITMVTQRSACINKNVLSQAEILICLQTIAPQDRDAIEHWVRAHGTEDQFKKMLSSMASLSVGEAWIWSPSWLNCFERVHIRRRETFDSSATPKVGTRLVAPTKLAPVDLQELKVKMASVVEQRKQDDPRELRKIIAEKDRLIAELKRQGSKPGEVKTERVEVKTERVEVPVMSRGEIERVARIADKCTILADTFDKSMTNLREDMHRLSQKCHDFLNMKLDERVPVRTIVQPKPKPAVLFLGDQHTEHVKHLGRCERAILRALAQHPDGLTRQQAALMSGYSLRSSGFANALSALRTGADIAGDSVNLKITDQGLKDLGAFDLLPTGAALGRYWMGQIGKYERTILGVLLANSTGFDRDALSEFAGYSANSSGFSNALSRLRTLGLIERGDPIVASKDLF